MRTETVTEEIVNMECGECGVLFWVTKNYYQERRRRKGLDWYCPNGHNRVFGETDVEILDRKLKEEQSKLASAQFELMAATKKVKRLEKRISNGVCPCCHRQFVGLTRHMKTKHPEFAQAEVTK